MGFLGIRGCFPSSPFDLASQVLPFTGVQNPAQRTFAPTQEQAVYHVRY